MAAQPAAAADISRLVRTRRGLRVCPVGVSQRTFTARRIGDLRYPTVNVSNLCNPPGGAPACGD